MSNKICLLVAYHKDSPTLNVSKKYFVPIHVGKSNSSLELSIQGDHTGENISSKNSNYCELTALFWAWKNVDSDFYGLMHYRRFFCLRDDSNFFGKQKIKLKKLLSSQHDFDDPKTIGSFENIENRFEALNNFFQKSVTNNTVFVSEKHKFSNKGIKSQYARFHDIKDWEIVSDIVIKKYPEHRILWECFENQKWMYPFNMFVMSKNIFSTYAEWVFDILGEVENNKAVGKSRVCGFISERLFNFYLLILQQDNPNVKITELNIVKIE